MRRKRVKVSRTYDVVGVLERRNPLPIGRYWLDVVDSPKGHVNAWTNFVKGEKRIKVRTTELDTSRTPNILFTIFEAKEPFTFPQRIFGFPNVATPDIDSQDDTVQRPPPVDPFENLKAFSSGMGIGTVLLIALGAYLLLPKNSRP